MLSSTPATQHLDLLQECDDDDEDEEEEEGETDFCGCQ